MDGIIRRVWNIVRCRSGGSSERQDNIQVRLESNLEELNRNIESVKHSVAVAMVDEKRLKMEYDEIFLSVRQWEDRAILALKQNDEDMATKALEKKGEYALSASRAEKRWENQKQAVDRLKSSLARVKDRVADVKREYALLTARSKTAETSRYVTRELSSIPEGSTGQLMKALDEKVSDIEAEAKAVNDVFGDDESEIVMSVNMPTEE